MHLNINLVKKQKKKKKSKKKKKKKEQESDFKTLIFFSWGLSREGVLDSKFKGDAVHKLLNHKLFWQKGTMPCISKLSYLCVEKYTDAFHQIPFLQTECS